MLEIGKYDIEIGKYIYNKMKTSQNYTSYRYIPSMGNYASLAQHYNTLYINNLIFK